MPAATVDQKTVLLVDDNHMAREGLGLVLRQQGFRVAPAANGLEALRFLEYCRPDPILLDMLMPVVDGWQFLEMVKQLAPPVKVPIIIITSGVLTREWAVDHGCAGFLKKPIDTAELLDEIHHCCA